MKRNLILLLICVLVGVIYFWDTERIEEQEKQEEIEKQLLNLEQEDIKEVTVVNEEGRFKAKKQEDRWRMIEPLDTEGDSTTWDSIVRNVATGEKQQVIDDEPEDLSIFGLDAPSLEVTVAGIDNATAQILQFGNETPTAGKYYAKIKDSSQVVTVRSSMYSNANKTLFDFRDKTIIELDNNEVQRIEISHVHFDGTLERRNEDEWLITDPYQARADEAQIRDMLNKISSAQIKQFIDENPEHLGTYGLVEPATKMVFWTGEPGKESSWAARALLLGATTPNDFIYAKREGQKNVFAVGPDDFNKVPRNLDSLLMKKVTAIRSWDVDEVNVRLAGENILEATKSSGDWYLVEEGDLVKADYNSMMDLVREITDLEIAEVVDQSTEALNLDDPFISLELIDEQSAQEDAEPEIEKISLAAPKGIEEATTYYGARKNPLEVYSITADQVSHLIRLTKEVKPEEEAEEPEVPAPGIDTEGMSENFEFNN